MTKPFLLAQISDLHIGASAELSFGRLDTSGMLRACVRDILALPQSPDAVVITGDLTDSGRAQEYAQLRELLEPLPMPLYMVPGNHDERDALRAAFPDHTYLRGSSRFIQYAIDAYPVRIVALDTLILGSGGGELCEERLAWLERTLAQAPEKPTVVLMHHPPFTTFIRYMDECGLRNPQDLAAVVEHHRQVEVVLCGHVHRPIEVRFAGTRASTAPSTAHQVQLDLDTRAPLALVMEPPAYRLHAYTPETGLVSHTAYVGDFATHRIVG
jgi:3',5'-cyclic AMP phosphodiesterase CpdA